MQKIVITEDIKTKQGINDKVISPSMLDDMLHNGEQSIENSKFLRELLGELIEITILAGFNVILVVPKVSDEVFTEMLDVSGRIAELYNNIKVQVIIE